MKNFTYLSGIICCTLLLSFTEILKDEQYYYGELKIKKNFIYYDSSYYMQNYMAYAYMYNDSVNYSQSWKAVNNSTVYFNDVPLQFNSLIRTYTDSVQRRTNRGINWTLYNSESGISSNISCEDLFPNLTNYNILSDKFNTTKDLTIDLSSISLADEIEITMYDGKFRSSVPYYRKVKANINSITIPSSDFVSLDGENVTVTVSLIKKEFKMVQGKRYKLERIYNFSRVMKSVITND